MSSGGKDLDSVQVMKQGEDRFFSKFLSKENSRISSSSSSRVYYCGGASVPFKWESSPGTPKHTLFFSESSHPLPLTPPPSYYSPKNSFIKKTNPNPKQNQHSLADIFYHGKKKKKKKSNLSSSFSWSPTSSSLSSTSSSPSFSSSPSSKKVITKTRKYYDDHHDEKVLGNSPTTPLCFGLKHRYSTGYVTEGFGCSMVKVKKALFSVLGQDFTNRKH